jgi:hypothetical protein
MIAETGQTFDLGNSGAGLASADLPSQRQARILGPLWMFAGVAQAEQEAPIPRPIRASAGQPHRRDPH